jgi:hypothetical protein
MGYLASTVELPRAWSSAAAETTDVADGWRRTAEGWQWRQAWVRPPESGTVAPLAWRLHPATLAALQLLLCLLALVCGASDQRFEHKPRDR